MTVPGNDCPECGARLSTDGCPRCAWGQRDPARPSAPTCDDCHEPTRAVQLTAGEDHRARCASCHVEALKRRAAPDGDPEVARCKTEFRRLMERAAVRWATRR